MTGQIWIGDHSGWLPIGTVSKVADVGLDWETDEPIVVLPKYEKTITATITATGPAARDLMFALTGMPFFYIPPRPQLPPAPDHRSRTSSPRREGGSRA